MQPSEPKQKPKQGNSRIYVTNMTNNIFPFRYLVIVVTGWCHKTCIIVTRLYT